MSYSSDLIGAIAAKIAGDDWTKAADTDRNNKIGKALHDSRKAAGESGIRGLQVPGDRRQCRGSPALLVQDGAGRLRLLVG
jgi:hypothetical protein